MSSLSKSKEKQKNIGRNPIVDCEQNSERIEKNRNEKNRKKQNRN
jgi:hypothetical protein